MPKILRRGWIKTCLKIIPELVAVGSLIGIQIGAENIPENWRKGLFDYPLNEKSLKEIANNTYNRSLLKELAVFPFRQTLLFILIILHVLYRAIGFVIFKR